MKDDSHIWPANIDEVFKEVFDQYITYGKSGYKYNGKDVRSLSIQEIWDLETYGTWITTKEELMVPEILERYGLLDEDKKELEKIRKLSEK